MKYDEVIVESTLWFREEGANEVARTEDRLCIRLLGGFSAVGPPYYIDSLLGGEEKDPKMTDI